MARDRTGILRAVKSELDIQGIELDELRRRQLQTVVTKSATGTGDIAHTFEQDRKFRLVFIRCHFSGTSGTAVFDIILDSTHGSAFDAQLFSISQAGIGSDVHLRLGDGDTNEPSAWTFQTGDKIRLDWTNPDTGNITWGVEVGMVIKVRFLTII